jgi:hypothetical protein
MTTKNAPYYEFADKLTQAALRFDFSELKNGKESAMFAVRKERLPADFRFEGHLLVGSPKEKAYDIASNCFASEKLADVIRAMTGETVRLIPYDTRHNPKAKFPVTHPPYYRIDAPFVECVSFVYGAEKETDAPYRKLKEKLGQPVPLTNPVLMDIKLDMDKVRGLHLFRPKELDATTLMSHEFCQACKAADVYGLKNMTYSQLFVYIKQAENSQNGVGLYAGG